MNLDYYYNMIKNTIKQILVPLDGSKTSFRALSNAINLAKQTDASITCIFVIQSSPTEMGLVRTIVGKTFSKKIKNFMRTAKTKCTRSKVEFVNVIEYGEEGRTIVSFAHKNNFDLIVMGSRGVGSVQEFFFGSTSNYVIHKSKIPILIVK